MRPLRLELEGFLSYGGRVEVDLSELGAVAVVGENGAGKTSLVEAIGWALYGKGRGRGPDDYVHAGATSCRVRFEFSLRGERWAVERQRASGASAKSYLGVFGWQDPQDQAHAPGWQAAGGDSISESQVAIERLLGMSYDTWLSSSYIGQGRADEFTRRRPAERKALLAEVLELGQYEELSQAARGRAKVAAGELAALEREAEQLATVVEQLTGAEEAHADALDEVSRAAVRAHEAERQERHAREAVEQARARVAEQEHLRRELESLRSGRQERRHGLHADGMRLRGDIERAAGAVENARAELGYAKAQGEQAATLEVEAEQHRQGVEDRAVRARECEGAALAAMAGAERALTGVQAELGRYGEALERRGALLRSPEGACYTCGQALTPEHVQEMVQALEAEMEAASIAKAALQATAATRRTEADEARALAAHHVEVARGLERKAVEALGAAVRARSDHARVPGLTERLTSSEAHLEELRARSASIAEAWAATEAPTREELALEERVAGVAELEQALQTAVGAATRTAGESQRAREHQLAAAREAERVQGAVVRLTEARSRVESVQARGVAAAVASSRWEELGRLFGRDGIPLLLIETAVPAIEEEANRILERLTAGRFQVALESQRATKGGELRDTLEVVVGDELSERPLEALSGGERQAVDLALRVALARLLATRAGAPVEALIVDEGATAFDAAHRQRIVEVLHELLAEFSCILFVTHLTEIAEAFPARLRVSRGPQGSEVVVER